MKAILCIGDFTKEIRIQEDDAQHYLYHPITHIKIQEFVTGKPKSIVDTTKIMIFRLTTEALDEFGNKIIYYDFDGVK